MKRIAWIAALSTLLLIPAACSKPAPSQPGPGAKTAPPMGKPAPASTATKTPPADLDTPKPGPAAPAEAPAAKKPKATASKSPAVSPLDEPGRDVKKPTDKADAAAKPKGVLGAMGEALLKGITSEDKRPPQ